MIQQTATLFPDARIDVFVLDPTTQAMAHALEQDWRLARVKMRIDQGDIQSAIQRYAQEKSPDVLIIETQVIDSSFTSHLEALANVCAPETSAIFIGPQNDINLYRDLLAMGATDYLVRPVQSEDLITVLSKALLHKTGTAQSRMITVMGSKGGVGTSRITQALAQAMIALDEKITLVDCGGSWGLMGSSYGLDPLITLRDAATVARTQEGNLDELRHMITPSLSWLATGGDPLLISTLSSEGFEAIADGLMRRHPNILVDLSQSATGMRAMAFAKAHHIVLVTMATPIALRNTRLLIKEIHGLRGADAPIHLVVNQRGILPKEEMRTSEITQALNLSPDAEIDYQPDLFAKLDTIEDGDFLQTMEILAPALLPVAQKITGKTAQISSIKKTSFVQRLLRKGA